MLNSGKVVDLKQKMLYSGKVVVLGQKWFYSGKSGSIRQGGCNCTNVVVFGQSCCIQAKKVVLFEQSGCIGAKVVVFGQSVCLRAKWLYWGKSGCTPEN